MGGVLDGDEPNALVDLTHNCEETEREASEAENSGKHEDEEEPPNKHMREELKKSETDGKGEESETEAQEETEEIEGTEVEERGKEIEVGTLTHNNEEEDEMKRPSLMSVLSRAQKAHSVKMSKGKVSKITSRS